MFELLNLFSVSSLDIYIYSCNCELLLNPTFTHTHTHPQYVCQQILHHSAEVWHRGFIHAYEQLYNKYAEPRNMDLLKKKGLFSQGWTWKLRNLKIKVTLKESKGNWWPVSVMVVTLRRHTMSSLFYFYHRSVCTVCYRNHCTVTHIRTCGPI